MNDRSIVTAMVNGFKGRCPHCGEGAMFNAFLKVNDVCPHCGEELHHHRADDAPPYMVMLIVGHVIVGLMLSIEVAFHPAMWLQGAIFLPLTAGLSLVLLQPVKGALVGLQWANRMHGFGAESEAGL